MSGGFQVQKKQSDGEFCGSLFTYDVAAGHSTLLAPGDVMTITGTSNTDGIPGIDAAGASTQVTGVLTSIDPIFAGEALSESGLPAATGSLVKLQVDPMILYAVDVENGPLLVTEVGLNADIVANVATKTGGLSTSNMTLNATGAGTSQALSFRIVQLLKSDAGVLGDRALVRINDGTISDGAAGI